MKKGVAGFTTFIGVALHKASLAMRAQLMNTYGVDIPQGPRLFGQWQPMTAIE